MDSKKWIATAKTEMIDANPAKKPPLLLLRMHV